MWMAFDTARISSLDLKMASPIENGTYRSPLKERNSQEDDFCLRSKLCTPSNRKKQQNATLDERIHAKVPSSDKKLNFQNFSHLQEGLESVTSSLSLLSETIGNALAESFNLLESKSCHVISPQTERTEQRLSDSVSKTSSSQPTNVSAGSDENFGFQLKPSRDIAMSMTSKAKFLVRELRTVKAELGFMKERTSQLEEDNRRLRSTIDKGVTPDEDDLIRLQLETLLAEKARLVQENSAYKRENQFLHEVIEYHQLTVQGMAVPDETL